jgi:hypothetical protein
LPLPSTPWMTGHHWNLWPANCKHAARYDVTISRSASLGSKSSRCRCIGVTSPAACLPYRGRNALIRLRLSVSVSVHISPDGLSGSKSTVSTRGCVTACDSVNASHADFVTLAFSVSIVNAQPPYHALN